MNTKLKNLRTTLEDLDAAGDVLRLTAEADPYLEIAACQKSLDNGPVLLFENIKGYPGVRHVGNIFARRERLARLFGVKEPNDFKFKCLEAIKKPVSPRLVDKAPCQEVAITKELDVLKILPALQYSSFDPGRMISGGAILISGEYARGGRELSIKRMHFRGPDWASVAANPASHAGLIRYIEARKQEIPMTINIGTPPAVTMAAGGSYLRTVVPLGTDEVAIAGGLQGFPVDLVKAVTVDAYAVAEAEWVIEGYWMPERVYESEEAERLNKDDVAPFFPEWTGYMGKARTVYKFKATAVTHRGDGPIFYAPLAHSIGHDYIINSTREACFYEMAQRINPGLVVDVNIPISFGCFGGIVFQVKKRRPLDEGFQKDILLSALSASTGLPTAIIVDEDVNIYSADDLLWALNTRVDPENGVFRGPKGSRGFGMFPIEAGRPFPGGVAIDATVPLLKKPEFIRGRYNIEKLDLAKWLSQGQIKEVQNQQSEYARFLGGTGY